jgi:hypothetical protein
MLRRHAPILTRGLLALGVAFTSGCGDISSPPTALPSRGGTGGSGGSATAGGGGAGRAGSAGQGGSAQAQGGAAGNDGAPDASAGGGGQGGGAGGGYMVPAGCPTPAPEPTDDQVIAIQSVRFGVDGCTGNACPEVVIRNVSNKDVTILGGQTGWNWCNVPAYWYVAATDVTLSPGETWTFEPIYNTSGPRFLYPGDDPSDSNELGIYASSGSFDSPTLIRAYVSWGEGPSLETREYVAVQAFRWTNGERITIKDGDGGFVATGPTDRASGYTSVPRRCLLYSPPNQ